MLGSCSRCACLFEGSDEDTNEPVLGHGILCPPCYRRVKREREDAVQKALHDAAPQMLAALKAIKRSYTSGPEDKLTTGDAWRLVYQAIDLAEKRS